MLTAVLGVVTYAQSPPASKLQFCVGVVGVVLFAAATVIATGIEASQPATPTLRVQVKLPDTEGVPEITTVPDVPLAK